MTGTVSMVEWALLDVLPTVCKVMTGMPKADMPIRPPLTRTIERWNKFSALKPRSVDDRSTLICRPYR